MVIFVRIIGTSKLITIAHNLVVLFFCSNTVLDKLSRIFQKFRISKKCTKYVSGSPLDQLKSTVNSSCQAKAILIKFARRECVAAGNGF